jgi:hypothetical protein
VEPDGREESTEEPTVLPVIETVGAGLTIEVALLFCLAGDESLA